MSTSRSQRAMSGSRTGASSFSQGQPSHSRLFSSILNPSRTNQGYIRADATVFEEDDELEGQSSQSEMNTGSSSRTPRQPTSAKAHGKRRAAWDGNTSELTVLRPNIHSDDKIHDNNSTDDEDDEVPQSFMIEATAGAARHPKPRGQPSDSQLGNKPLATTTANRGRPLHSNAARSQPPLLPTVAPHVSIPPKPSELDYESGTTKGPRVAHAASTSTSSNNGGRRARPAGALDEYEKALWNWVNVYNLDAFLQEVYMYYEGKGLYSIALKKGLNLLCVFSSSHILAGSNASRIERWALSLASPHSYWAVLTIPSSVMAKSLDLTKW